MRQHIISPMGLRSDQLGFEINDNTHATGYHRKWSLSNLVLSMIIDKDKLMGEREGVWLPFKPMYVNGAAYGGLIGTPAAMMKYIQCLIKADGTLLSVASQSKLFEPNILNNGKKSDMCLSWFKGKLGNNVYYTHAGGGGGYYVEIRYYPELGKGSVIVFNRSGMSDARFFDRLDACFF